MLHNNDVWRPKWVHKTRHKGIDLGGSWANVYHAEQLGQHLEPAFMLQRSDRCHQEIHMGVMASRLHIGKGKSPPAAKVGQRPTSLAEQ